MDFLQHLGVTPVDIVISILSLLIGRVTMKNSRGLGLLLQVSLLLLKITKHYFDTHPDATKFAHKYKLKVDHLYHKTAQVEKVGAAG